MRAFCPPKNSPEKDLVMTPEYLAKDIINHLLNFLTDDLIVI